MMVAAAGRGLTAVLVVAFRVVVTIRIPIRLASCQAFGRVLAIGMLGLTVLANPIVCIDVRGGGNQFPGPDPSDAVVVELAGAALAESHVGGLWRPAQAAIIAGNVLSLRGGHIGSP